MYEDFEGCSDNSNLEGVSDAKSLCDRATISETESMYIEEVLPYKDSDLISARIDEMGGRVPPKAIDANREVAELIGPIINEINPIYLEAPADSLQIAEASEAMNEIEGLDYNVWKEISFDERVATLQTLESRMAGIAHRPECSLNIQNLGEGYYGYFNPETKDITVNSHYIRSDNFLDYQECLDTIIHEGRHAYQDYNVTTREVHPRGAEIENWRLNSDSDLGYLDAQTWGFELYEYQPMEADARAFADDVLNHYLNK